MQRLRESHQAIAESSDHRLAVAARLPEVQRGSRTGRRQRNQATAEKVTDSTAVVWGLFVPLEEVEVAGRDLPDPEADACYEAGATRTSDRSEP